MSILIKGMTMPKNCSDCPCFDDFGYYTCNLDDEHRDVYNGRPEWCPLVELPEKHGRLIDGDELFRQMNTAIAMMSGMMKVIGTEDDDGMQMELKAYRDIRDGIKDYDTVIEAEGE